jgi:hypothetical protein
LAALRERNRLLQKLADDGVEYANLLRECIDVADKNDSETTTTTTTLSRKETDV